ncbi:MAG: class I SAM-dependent methyltransferase [Chloroflexi bacterium]|nr:class I SAM-dependent methyltransferase [Chloroflexota bacterium]
MKQSNQHTTDEQYLTEQQYASEDQLSVRIRTHELYSQPKNDFPQWVLDHIDWQDIDTVLDVGCGAGIYIPNLQKRLSPQGMIISADISMGMLRDVAKKPFAASTNLLNARARHTPLPDDSCDVVLANHMLYHVPDIPAVIQEIRRILRPGGALIATTNAESSMLTFLDEIQAAYQALGMPITLLPTPFRKNFSLESGGEFITQYLQHMEIHRFESALVFPEAAPVLAYIQSMHTFYESHLPTQIKWADVLEQLQKQIAGIIQNDGVYRVSKTAGVFIAHKG